MSEAEAVVVMPAESAAENIAEETKPSPESAAEEIAQKTSEETPEKRPEKGGVQRRIDELTRKSKLAEAEAEFWRQKALGTAPAKAADDDKPKAKPNPADFETTEAYLEARDAWVREETMRQVDERFAKERSQQEAKSEAEMLAAEWSERETEFQSQHEDYDAVTGEAMDTLAALQGPAQAAIAHAIQYSEQGPELLYQLGQHPEELRSLVRLHPTQAVIALGRMEARLPQKEGGEEKEPPPQTRAPKPPTPLRKPSPGAKPAPDDPESDKGMSDEEWLKARQRQIRERSR